MMNRFLFFLFLTFPIIDASGQKTLLQNDKEAVDTLFFTDLDKALKISEKNIPIAVSINDTNFVTYYLDQAGELNRKAGKYDRSIEQLQKCLGYKKNWKDLKDLSLTHNNLGKAYLNKGQYERSVFHFLEALKLMEIDGNLKGQGFYLNNLAAVYDLQHNYKKALFYYEKSLVLKKEIGDSTGIAASYTNLGITYFNLGDFKNAINFNEKAYKIYSKLDLKTKIARNLNNLGEAFIQINQNSKALQKHLQAYALDSVNEDMYLRITVTTNLGHSYLVNNNIDSARYFVKKAENLALQTKSFKNLKDIYNIQSQIAEKERNPEAALRYLKKFIAYNDTLINEANINAVTEMEAKYEHEKNLRLIGEGEVEILKREKIIENEKFKVLFWLGISIVLIIIVLVSFAILYLKQKNTGLLKGQISLIEATNKSLKKLNDSIKTELDTTQITLEEKEKLLDNVFTSSKNKDLPPEILALSKREMEVLSHLTLGWSDDQLAEKLFISKSTVKTHLRRIYSKLVVRSRAEAVAIAHKYDLIGGAFEELDESI